MRKLKVIAVLLVLVSVLFAACGEDDEKTSAATKKADSVNESNNSAGEDSDAWWKKYVTEDETVKRSSNKTTTKSDSTTKSSSKTTTKKSSSGGSGGSATTTKKSTAAATTTLPYTKVSQYTMTYANVNGGTTTLSKDPSNKFIKAAISKLSSARSETFTATQMMYYGYGDGNFVFVYTSSSSKSNSTLKYVIGFNSDASLQSNVKKSVDGVASPALEYAYFPYASSGSSDYNTYRTDYISMVKESGYDSLKDTYSPVNNDENVKVFLSW